MCVCEYTNWIKAIPLVDQKAGTIADAIFFRIICEYGTPKAIICDEGPAFTSDLMKIYFHAMNIKPYYISPMNHGSNRAERYIRTLNDIICRNLTGIGEKWPLFIYHPLGSVLQSPSRKLNRNWIGPLRVQTVLDNTHYLCSDWSGKLIPKRFHINRLKQYYMNLGELGEDGQLKIVQNVNELYEKWNELKEDEMITDSAQKNVNNGKIA